MDVPIMDKSWIKLYRKIKHNPILRDSYALQVFIWVLVNANPESGEYITGRYHGAESLGIPPSSFRNSLERLERKYKIVDSRRTAQYTVIRVLNWSKFQSKDSLNEKIGQQEDTTKDIDKNKKQYIGKKLHPLLEKYFQALSGAGLPDPLPFVSGDSGRFNEKSYLDSLKPSHFMDFAVVKEKLQGGQI